MNFRKLQIAMMTATALLAFATLAVAAAPNLLNYQGRLTTPGGTPVIDNTYAVTFSIYSTASGGSAIWTETQPVTTVAGIFSAVLGATIPFSEDLFSDSTRYLGIKVGADPEISPRTRLASVPYARGADNGWRDVGGAILQNNSYDFVGIGTTNPSRPLHVNEPSGSLFVSRMESSHPDATVTEISNTSANAIWEASVAGANGIPFWGIQPGDMYFYKQGTSWPNAVLTSGGSLGLGTSLPRARVEAVTLDSTAGLFLSGSSSLHTRVIHGEFTGSDQIDAVGVFGRSVPGDYYGIGGLFEGGFMGVRGVVSKDGTDSYFGTTGFAYGEGSGSKCGVDGEAGGFNGTKYGVRGKATGGGGDKYGVYGSASGSEGIRYGVYGSATGDYGSDGGHFVASGIGCFGVVSEATGVACDGLYAKADGTGATGVKAEVFNTSSYAGYFIGNVNVAGTFSKLAGSFKIDHPLDPENKYLQHSFVESPDMMNIYNGNVVTDANGNATITLPDYFDALNKEFRYQLTCVGGYAPVYIATKVSGNSFSIAGGTPGLEVSWQVTGIRKDAYAEKNRIQVEVDKNERERGKYAVPEVYGKGREFGVGYREELEKRAPSTAPTMDEEKLKIEKK